MRAPLERAITLAGSQSALARAIGVSQQAISLWLKNGGLVPPEHCPAIELATGVKRQELRPEIFGVAANEAAQ